MPEHGSFWSGEDARAAELVKGLVERDTPRRNLRPCTAQTMPRQPPLRSFANCDVAVHLIGTVDAMVDDGLITIDQASRKKGFETECYVERQGAIKRPMIEP